jgi:outer membrane biogenesis lipoprotein LolB
MHMPRAMPSILLPACLLLAACSAPKPPEEERRPEPQAPVTAQPKSALVETADGYKDAARASVAASEDAAKREQAELDAATQ